MKNLLHVSKILNSFKQAEYQRNFYGRIYKERILKSNSSGFKQSINRQRRLCSSRSNRISENSSLEKLLFGILFSWLIRNHLILIIKTRNSTWQRLEIFFWLIATNEEFNIYPLGVSKSSHVSEASQDSLKEPSVSFLRDENFESKLKISYRKQTLLHDFVYIQVYR